MPSETRPAMVLLVAAFALLSLPREVPAQLPKPRLQSLLPLGAAAGDCVDVTLTGTDLEGVNALWFDHPGLRAFHLKGLTFRLAIAPGAPVGQHDVRAVGTYGVSNPRVFVVGDRPERREAEPNNQPGQANPIAWNSVVSGDLAATDVDCYRFEGRKGQRVFLEAWAARIDSRMEAIVRVLGPDGAEIAEGTGDSGPDPFLDVTLPADGLYVVKVHDVIYRGSPEYGYRLSLGDRPRVDAIFPPVAAPGVATTFTVWGRNLGGVASPVERVDGRPLERKEVTITPPTAADADPASPGVESLPSASATRRGFLHRVEGPGGPSNPVFIAAATDPVVIEREPNDDGEHAQEVTLPCDIAGAFASAGDYDVYRFRGRKGDVWWFEAWAERLGSPADPTFLIQKVADQGPPQDLANGDDLADLGSGPRFPTSSVDAALRWQVPEDGLYQVVINDLYNAQRGDVRLTYRLNIRPERPDFALFVVPANPKAVEAVAVGAGGRASAYAVVARIDGFNRPIRVEARELPPGVSCDPVVIGPGQTAAPLVFGAAEGARPTVGPARLVGRALSGDRKEVLDYVKGSTPPGPEPTREALAGGIIWPPGLINALPAPASARATRGFVLAVRDEAPFALDVRPSRAVVAAGDKVELAVEVVRRAGFAEAVQLSASDLPPNMAGASATIPKDKTSATLTLPVAANVPPGMYTILVRGAGAYPFSKDPNAKQKPNVTLDEPSNPITLTVRK